ncbi:hypothetical protein [Lysobacter silvisoli]|uniref:Secreted protein n=1 Tax=Lysobacter silvisoli TaxID=2293254 RepID=A0A371K051_9GAMM|nr:hypothetical protein [Lysobacter silvisoli]RDZ27264.1 hypothetical protein DX914_13535 [Lysobacter silvisoli]
MTLQLLPLQARALRPLTLAALLCAGAALAAPPPVAKVEECKPATDDSHPHLPWCADRANVPCHKDAESCRKLADTVNNVCNVTYANCYVRFAKVSDKGACAKSMQEFRDQLDGLACNWPRDPEPVVGSCKGQDYVRYRDVVKVGGRPTWRNNNPGALTCLKNRADYGAYQTCQSFAIFPDLPTGIHALYQWLQANKGRSLYQFAATHAPPDNGAVLNKGNDPEAYTAALLKELRKDNPGKTYSRDTLLGSLSEDELGSVVRGVTLQEGSTAAVNQGKTYELDDPASMPADLKACLGL